MSQPTLRSAALACAVLTPLLAVPAAAQSDILRDYNKTITQSGFEPVYPATSGVKPGYLYTEQKGGDGKKIQTPVCSAMFSTSNDAPANLSLASVKAKDTKELSLGLGLDPAVLKGKGDVSADLKSAGVSDGSLGFGAPQKNSIPALVSVSGTQREVLQACQNAIKPYFGSDGKPTRAMYMVVSTLAVDAIAYDINVKKTLEAGLKGALEKIFKLAFGYKKTSDTTARISFNSTGEGDRRVVGVTRIKITQLDYNTQVAKTQGGKVASVKSEAVPVTETPIVLPALP